jgi:microsomal dipeptidase-like Zn-dependent dipeptidase
LYPIVDLNGCLLHYLDTVQGADPSRVDDIGCSVPHLLAGNVKIQVLAVFAGGEPDSAALAWRQVERFLDLLRQVKSLRPVQDPEGSLSAEGVGVVLGIENATCLCADGESLEVAFARFERIREVAGRLFYLTLTRQAENRFGGGSDSRTGLKDDGRALLEYLSGRRVALDLAHSSEALACDALEYIDRRGLSIPVLASHSNFRAVWQHPSNLVDSVAREVIRRGGLIGMNLLRAFLHSDDADALARHVEHGLGLGGENALALGSDFFYSRGHPDRSREPFYFAEHEHAGKYQTIVASLEQRIGRAPCEGLASANAVRFLRRLWDEP